MKQWAKLIIVIYIFQNINIDLNKMSLRKYKGLDYDASKYQTTG